MRRWGVTCGLTLAAMTIVGACAAIDRDSPVAGPTAQPAAYRLGAGDRLRMTVFGEDAMTGEFVVSGAGTVALPLIGDVQAAGLTTADLTQAVRGRLRAGYLKDPRVSVEVLNYRPFYILGEVNKPGEYPYTDSLTVSNAVATAGGFTYRANTGRVYIRHAGETDERAERLTSGASVLPGDTLRVPQRLF